MKKIGFVFATAPHGVSSGREGLDALLATSAYTDNLRVFFVGDGVFQLLRNQAPDLILSRNYISTFKMLSLCDINEIYVCDEALSDRDASQEGLIIEVEKKDKSTLSTLMAECDHLLRF